MEFRNRPPGQHLALEGVRWAWRSGALLTLCLAAFWTPPARALEDPWRPAPSAAASFNPVLNPTNGLGSWIWTTNCYPRQTCRLWKSFEVPSSAVVVRALLRMTADNGYTLFLDGRELGKGINWRLVTEYDVTWLLEPGTHVLAVDAFNDMDTTGPNLAGVILGLRIVFADGRNLEVASDPSWRIAPQTERNWQTVRHASAWPAAKVVSPWGGRREWVAPFKIISVPPEPPVPIRFWQRGWFQITILSLCGMVVLVCLRLMAQVTLQSKAQQLLQLERARIARDIHDDLGAGLTKLVLLGEVAQSELQADSETRAQISQLCERARELSHAMDEVVWAINSRRDTLRDFASYVCKYAQAFLSSTPIRCRLDVEPELPTLAFDLPIRRNLFLAVKEALNNAAKHSGATELYLRVHRQGEGLRVVVEDNGKGIDLAQASPERNGLTNMAQRMKEVGGSCHLSGEPGAGCRVVFTLPRLQGQRRAHWFRWRRDTPATGAGLAEAPPGVAPEPARPRFKNN